MISSETLGTLLEREHRQIDDGVEAFVAAPEGDEQLGRLREAAAALKRHIYIEEALLFPTLRAAGLAAPVFVMLREHGEIWGVLDELEAAAQAGAQENRATMVALCQQLMAHLEAHNMKEESVLYPRTDEAVTGAAATEAKAFLESGEMPAGWVCAQAPR